ncbi:relaxase/mobilization nuclease domain-containing protein [Pedobacter sp. P351]|uniref:relaxase/mobilization nuclease domain-containing protein n=1 Tax=Pedobacter superstes TaxID=3133441 RepID=UPI0030AA5041
MIGKVKTGKSFAGCIHYNLEREEATILHAEGIRTDSIQHIIRDFNMQRKMNPELGQAVGHIVLSWSVQDKEKLSPEAMADHAKEYLQKMKIADTQLLVVQHHDREHPHIHIVYNRVNNDAKTISDQYQRKRNAEVCKQLTLKYNYHMAQGKAQVNRARLTGADRIKYQLYDAIKETSAQAKTWIELANLLTRHGIELHYKYKGGTAEVQGISFSKDGLKLKGSEIDRSLSYGKLNQVLTNNLMSSQKQGSNIGNLTTLNKEPVKKTYLKPPQVTNYLKPKNTDKPLLESLLTITPNDYPNIMKEEKKKKRKHQGLSL